jgi:hypothetical protein
MDARDLDVLLSQSMAGFLNYSPGYMAKSAVFAAFCAHRMIPVTAQDLHSEADGVRCGVHYYRVGDGATLAAGPQAIADAAWTWYQGHSLRSHARTFAGVLAQAEPPREQV